MLLVKQIVWIKRFSLWRNCRYLNKNLIMLRGNFLLCNLIRCIRLRRKLFRREDIRSFRIFIPIPLWKLLIKRKEKGRASWCWGRSLINSRGRIWRGLISLVKIGKLKVFKSGLLVGESDKMKLPKMRNTRAKFNWKKVNTKQWLKSTLWNQSIMTSTNLRKRTWKSKDNLMRSNKSFLKELKKSDKRAKWWKRQRWVLSPGTENKWEKKED